MKLNIQVINKNLSNGQFKAYPFIENSLYINNYNETLDSFKGRIVHQEDPIDIEPYDDVKITGDDGTTRYMMVERKSIRQETIGADNKYYTYELELCSQIKHLEGIVCPNLSITPLRVGTKRSIYEYLRRYLDLYGYKRRILHTKTTSQFVNLTQNPNTYTIRITDDAFKGNNIKTVRAGFVTLTMTITNISWSTVGNQVVVTINYTGTPIIQVQALNIYVDYLTFDNEYHFSQRVIDKFSQIDAPETQWNAPTLREVFNDLFLMGDCIPTMQNGEIDYIDLTKRYDEIHDSDVNYIERSQSADDYVSEIKMDMQNVLQTSMDGVRNVCTTTEYVTLSSNSYLITSENAILKTTYPILNIKHLWVGIFVPGTLTQNATTKANFIIRDLMDFNGQSYVKEAQEYSTLKIAYRLNDIEAGSESEFQNYNLSFQRNGRDITGFTNQSKGILWEIETTLNLLKDAIVKDARARGETTLSNDELRLHQINAYFSTFFKIEYETMTDQVFTASKQHAKNKRTIVDNQTNSWVDAYTQGFMEYQKANRLGNEVYVFNQRVNSIANAIKIGDFYYVTENDIPRAIIIYQTQYQIFSDHIEVNAIGTKDYILRNYWTGVNSKIRTWVNAKDEAMVRHELVKFYGEISFTPHNELESITNDYDIAQLMSLGIKTGVSNKQIQYSAIQTKTIDGLVRPINNLAGTIWHLNSTIDWQYIISDAEYPNTTGTIDVTFEIIHEGIRTIYNQILIKNYTPSGSSTTQHIMHFIDEDGEDFAVWNDTAGWVQDYYRTFAITGGNQATNYNLAKFFINNGELIETAYKYTVETISRVIGQSIVITTGFNDNYLIANVVKTGADGIEESSISPIFYRKGDGQGYQEPIIMNNHLIETLVSGVRGIPTVSVSYTDENGEFIECNVEFFTTLEQPIEEDMNEDKQKAFYLETMARPITSIERIDDIRLNVKKDFYKDNKEIFKLSTQLEILGSDEIYTTKYLLMNNRIIQDQSTIREVRYYLSNQDTDVVPREKLPDDAVMFNPTATYTHISNTCQKVKLEWANTQALQGRILYITDHNNNIMVGMACRPKSVDPFTTQYTEFYINVYADRDTRYYDENGIVKGEI